MRTTSILLVDDEPAFLDSLQSELSTYGYNVATTLNGDEAIRTLGEKRCDLVITDQTMQTSMKGVFAAGDVRAGATAQLALAAGAVGRGAGYH